MTVDYTVNVIKFKLLYIISMSFTKHETEEYLSSLNVDKQELLKHLQSLWSKSGKYFQLDEYSIPLECMPEVAITGLIGTGSEGKVYALAQTDDVTSRKVIKIIPLVDIHQDECVVDPGALSIPGQVTTEDFFREVEMAKKMATLGVSPKVYDAHICKNVETVTTDNLTTSVGMIISARVDITLQGYIIKYPGLISEMYNRLLDMFLDLASRIMKSGYWDPDMHFTNIMINLDADMRPTSMYNVDLGAVHNWKETYAGEAEIILNTEKRAFERRRNYLRMYDTS